MSYQLSLIIELDDCQKTLLKLAEIQCWTSIPSDNVDMERVSLKALNKIAPALVKKSPEYQITLKELSPTIKKKDGTILTYYRPYDRIFFQLMAWTSVTRNESRVGMMKYGDCYLMLSDIVQAIQKDPNQSNWSFLRPLTMKTYEIHGQPAYCGGLKITVLRKTPEMRIFDLVDLLKDKKPYLSNEIIEDFKYGWSVFEEYVKKQSNLLKSIGPDLNEEIAPYEIYAFMTATVNPLTNFFRFPIENKKSYKKKITASLFNKLFTLNEQKFFNYIEANSVEIDRYRAYINQEKPTKSNEFYNAYGCIIFAMSICYLSQTLPYISDEACKQLKLEEIKSLYNMMEGTAVDPETLLQSMYKSIESFQDCFSTVCGDCEDLSRGIMIIYLMFLNCDNVSPFYRYISESYVLFANLGTVTASHPQMNTKSGREEYPTKDQVAIYPHGGHVFCILMPYEKMKSKSLELMETEVISNPFAKSLIQSPWNQIFQTKDMPTMIAEGTAFEWPLFGSWQTQFQNPKLKQHFKNLQEKAIQRDISNRSCIMKLIQGTQGEIFDTIMISQCIEAGEVDSWFYRFGKQCFTGVSYLRSDESDPVFEPTSFCWCTIHEKQLKKGAWTSDIIYNKPDVKLLVLPRSTPIDLAIERRRFENLPPPVIPMFYDKEWKLAQHKLVNNDFYHLDLQFPIFHLKFPEFQKTLNDLLDSLQREGQIKYHILEREKITTQFEKARLLIGLPKSE